jgi:acyl-CoA reductase-like NAD-dependent aldehyde dehydrogenase
MNKLEVTNPFDHSHVGEVPITAWDEVDTMLEHASKAFGDRKQRLTVPRRMEILENAAAIMQQRFDILALLIASEGGKPLIDARVEVARAIDGLKLCLHELTHMGGSEIPMNLNAASAGRAAFTFREPIGPVVAISAFNHPLNLIVHQVAPAVAVGCPVIIKPADDTPLSALAFVEILYEAGLPQNLCQFVVTDIPTAERMVTDPRVAFFSFIGSARVGWMLRSKLAPGTRCALEHGGAAPVIIDESAAMESMIPSLVKGGFYHAGQVCVSVQRVFAPHNIAGEIAQALAADAETLVVGNAIDETTEVGPLIRPAEVKRVQQWVDEAVAAGATALCGARDLGETTYAPTVLLDPPANATVSTREIFGPVVCVYGYHDLDAALAQANSLPFAFQAACFSNRLDTALKCVQQLDASAVMVNDHTAFRVDWMPFAGRRQSGYGVGGIGHTMHDMTQEKMMVLNGFAAN